MACASQIASGLARLWLAAAGEPASTRLVIGTEESFPPYVMRDDQGQLSGFEVELMAEICTRTARDCEWQSAPFSALIPGVSEGRFDVVLGGLAITPERRVMVDFTIPYTWSDEQEWFIGYPGAPAPAEASIAVERGTIHEAWLRGERLDYRSLASEAAVLEAVRSGATDLALGPFAGRLDLNPGIESSGLDYVASALIPDEGTGIAFCKGDHALKAALDQAITDITADGTLAGLNARWF
ncbi:ABC transporter substrate-binding protein [Pseudogemmobacter faecipullorum]|uniref:Amino acid ABC transporter substrate-binding protein n=1 Tax=Pseudogemmobacter faecipullorum TaxID=2755041 RepID=A0ABS8CSY9_9RHOB|nr:transporter substrate-binding domain-containing protein [Pseudogemmobacter faecipullorum]MCB5411905.1 amino acid ABC transporter substrate-binding protein [Pseudogemmobacter faecipullorum]